MEKPKHIPIIDHSKPKKTPTNYVRNASSDAPKLKSKTPVNSSKKAPGWIKKQDDSWDY